MHGSDTSQALLERPYVVCLLETYHDRGWTLKSEVILRALSLLANDDAT